MTQKTLSAFRSDGRGLCRFRTATCCRRARISVWSAARSAKISMILCMPERVSGGDAKFQGFCHRWNKWEGQGLAERPAGFRRRIPHLGVRAGKSHLINGLLSRVALTTPSFSCADESPLRPIGSLPAGKLANCGPRVFQSRRPRRPRSRRALRCAGCRARRRHGPRRWRPRRALAGKCRPPGGRLGASPAAARSRAAGGCGYVRDRPRPRHGPVIGDAVRELRCGRRTAAVDPTVRHGARSPPTVQIPACALTHGAPTWGM